jgi:hypothetical protein
MTDVSVYWLSREPTERSFYLFSINPEMDRNSVGVHP